MKAIQELPTSEPPSAKTNRRADNLKHAHRQTMTCKRTEPAQASKKSPTPRPSRARSGSTSRPMTATGCQT